MKNPENEFVSAVFDNGRRGQPKTGCDCVQCFGYCIGSGADVSMPGQSRQNAPVDLVLKSHVYRDGADHNTYGDGE